MCSMNAPVMVDVGDETDPLEVRPDGLAMDNKLALHNAKHMHALLQ